MVAGIRCVSEHIDAEIGVYRFALRRDHFSEVVGQVKLLSRLQKDLPVGDGFRNVFPRLGSVSIIDADGIDFRRLDGILAVSVCKIIHPVGNFLRHLHDSAAGAVLDGNGIIGQIIERVLIGQRKQLYALHVMIVVEI